MAPALLRSGTEGRTESGMAARTGGGDDSALESGGESHCAMIGADSQRVSCPATRSCAPCQPGWMWWISAFAALRPDQVPGRLEKRLFSKQRGIRGLSEDPVRHLAARFAAKEAVGKLLGCGVTSWQDILVRVAVPRLACCWSGGRPTRRRHWGWARIALSLSHAATTGSERRGRCRREAE